MFSPRLGRRSGIVMNAWVLNYSVRSRSIIFSDYLKIFTFPSKKRRKFWWIVLGWLGSREIIHFPSNKTGCSLRMQCMHIFLHWIVILSSFPSHTAPTTTNGEHRESLSYFHTLYFTLPFLFLLFRFIYSALIFLCDNNCNITTGYACIFVYMEYCL